MWSPTLWIDSLVSKDYTTLICCEKMLWFSFFVGAFHCLLNENWRFLACKQALSWLFISYHEFGLIEIYYLIFLTLTTIFFSYMFLFWIYYCATPTVSLLGKADPPSFQVPIIRLGNHCLYTGINLEHMQHPFSESGFINYNFIVKSV